MKINKKWIIVSSIAIFLLIAVIIGIRAGRYNESKSNGFEEFLTEAEQAEIQANLNRLAEQEKAVTSAEIWSAEAAEQN